MNFLTTLLDSLQAFLDKKAGTSTVAPAPVEPLVPSTQSGTTSFVDNMKHFKRSEVACHCGCGLVPLDATLIKLEEIREQYGKPLSINSGARCVAYNAKIGGAKNSNHCKGQAIDISRTPDFFDYISKNLEHHDIYIESPIVTKTWVHFQINPPASGSRIFNP